MLDAFFRQFGSSVRQRRLQKKLTQEDLVQELRRMGVGITQGYISLLESGNRKDPNIAKVLALAAVLDISLDGLLQSVMGESNIE